MCECDSRPNGTWMNSFLFNIMILMMSTLAVCHFLSEAFSNYMRLTKMNLLFSIMIKNISFFKFFFRNNIFIWILLVLLYNPAVLDYCNPHISIFQTSY